MHGQTIITTAPRTNAEGYQRAYEQLAKISQSGQYPTGSTSGYDRKSDTFWMRFGFSRPSVTYYYPDNPLFLFMLDRVTGELVGIELTHFRSVLVKQKPDLKSMLPKSGLFSLFGKNRKRGSRGIAEGFGRLIASAVSDNCHRYA